MYSNNGDTCRAIALSDGGIIMQPSFMVSGDLKHGQLVRVLPECRSREQGIYAVYPSRKKLPLTVRCLVDFLVEPFQTPPWYVSGPVSNTD